MHCYISKTDDTQSHFIQQNIYLEKRSTIICE